MEIVSIAVVLTQTTDEKIPQIIFFFSNHVEGSIKKFGKDDEVDGNVGL